MMQQLYNALNLQKQVALAQVAPPSCSLHGFNVCRSYPRLTSAMLHPSCMACHRWPASQGNSGVFSTHARAARGRKAHPLLQVARVQKLWARMQELGLSDADAAGSDYLQPPQSNSTPADPVSSTRWVHAPDSHMCQAEQSTICEMAV